MLPVESVLDHSARVDLVEDPVSIVLEGGREDHQLIVMTEFAEESVQAGTNHVKDLLLVTIVLLLKVNEGLI